VTTSAKFLKIWAKWRRTFAESHEDLFLEVIPKEVLLEKMFAQNLAQNFFGQV